MAKNDQIHLRCSKEDKEEVKKYLSQLGKKTDFLIEFFLDNMRTTTPIGLKIQKHILQKELEQIEEERKKLLSKTEELEIKINAIDDRINNSDLYDIKFYENDENVSNAIKALKKYASRTSSIMSVEHFPKKIMRDVAEANNLDPDELKKIASTDFKNWF